MEGSAASKVAASSSGIRFRIRATAKVEKLMRTFSPDRVRSPVIDRAVELDARQYPDSCAAAGREQTILDNKIAQSNVSRFIRRGLHFGLLPRK